jgi:hypothetical protein
LAAVTLVDREYEFVPMMTMMRRMPTVVYWYLLQLLSLSLVAVDVTDMDPIGHQRYLSLLLLLLFLVLQQVNSHDHHFV